MKPFLPEVYIVITILGFSAYTIIVRSGSRLWAYPVRSVAQLAGERGWIEKQLGDRRIRLTYLKEADSLRIESLDTPATDLAMAYTFWFAWYAMHPDTLVFNPDLR